MKLTELNEINERVESLKQDQQRIREIFDTSENFGISPSETVEIQIVHRSKNDVIKVPVKLHEKIKDDIIKHFQEDIDLYQPALNLATGIIKKVPYPRTPKEQPAKVPDGVRMMLIAHSNAEKDLLKRANSNKRKNILTMNAPQPGDSLKEADIENPKINVRLV